MEQTLDHSVANFSQVTPLARDEAKSGIELDSNEPHVIPKGTLLYRIGHETKKRIKYDLWKNFKSPWWIYESDFMKILALGQRDPAWAGQVAMAIAENWGGDCRLQVNVELAEPLYAWSGQGKVISGSDIPGL